MTICGNQTVSFSFKFSFSVSRSPCRLDCGLENSTKGSTWGWTNIIKVEQGRESIVVECDAQVNIAHPNLVPQVAATKWVSDKDCLLVPAAALVTGLVTFLFQQNKFLLG